MKSPHALFVSALILSTAVAMGCRKESTRSEQTDSQTAAAQTSTTATEPGASSAAPYDLQFFDTMSKHHHEAIDMAKMGQGKIEHARLKELAIRIPTDQQEEIDQMKAWRDQWYPNAPAAENMQMTGMSGGMNMDMSSMQSMKAGHDFDAVFIDMMIPHHQSAIQMWQDALTKAEHSEVKTLAQQIIDKQKSEVEQMKQWKASIESGRVH